jgi:hypothetical protein
MVTTQVRCTDFSGQLEKIAHQPVRCSLGLSRYIKWMDLYVAYSARSIYVNLRMASYSIAQYSLYSAYPSLTKRSLTLK